MARAATAVARPAMDAVVTRRTLLKDDGVFEGRHPSSWLGIAV
ncbi:hypothetical protein STVIR_8826 [Streptomyces viridochromogenes Tue57]|uniref:Uncharacterized protein n=1 Tax=Streptomyces viridochromogenes Tue57 TaxID=1160705 RepID=L8P230_STRVR|nr:hypothetical protein STVIR_8826 [Streptomyces viridochromogenes Tue57]